MNVIPVPGQGSAAGRDVRRDAAVRPSAWSKGVFRTLALLTLVAAVVIVSASETASALLPLALVFLLGVGGWLAVIDVRTHLLPNWLIFPSIAVVAVLLALQWASTGNGEPVLRAGICAAVTFVVYLAMSLGGSLGQGDVKLGLLLGLALGWAGWSAALAGPVIGFVLGGLVALVLLARGRGRSSHLAFGPYLIAGALIAAVQHFL